ncbi:MAG: hypothetical protein EOO75_12975 [Myxococcales bacterium]|nr:MAG: hypothetical protein EOO75_12975 [Myxococcales bacterium]
MTDRAIEATSDGTRVHVRITGSDPLSCEEATDLARRLLAALPADVMAAVAREALDAVRPAETHLPGRVLEVYHEEQVWLASEQPPPVTGSPEALAGKRQVEQQADAILAGLAALTSDPEHHEPE